MAIDGKTFTKPAIRGDVSGVAINCAIAIDYIADCLEAINNQQQMDPQSIAKIRESARTIQGIFEELAGWTKD